jgi:ABC-type phosphate transport system auxiliary subunit
VSTFLAVLGLVLAVLYPAVALAVVLAVCAVLGLLIVRASRAARYPWPSAAARGTS